MTESAPGTPARTIVHVDMDAFFASVEILDNPELRGRPVIVGGAGARGVVAAASYEARAYGVHSAMAGSVARRKCPQAVFLDGRHSRYREVSEQVMAIFAQVTPLVEPLSLDEAFLDVTGRRRSLGDGATIATMIRSRVLAEVGLTCSIGVAPNKFLAKLATEAAKPTATPAGPVFSDGVAVVAPERVQAFLDSLAVGAMWGVGPKTRERLERLGVATVAQLRALPIEALVSSLGQGTGEHLFALARGIDDRPVVANGAAKSVSHEVTFATDLVHRPSLDREVVRLADAVAARLRSSATQGRTVAMKIRFGTFETLSRAKTVPTALDDGLAIAAVCRSILDEIDTSRGIRLIGVGVTNLAPRAERSAQLSLLDGGDEANLDKTELNDTIDAIRERFGRASIGPASVAATTEGEVFEPGKRQWGPGA